MKKPNEELLDAIGGVGLDLVEQSELAGPFGSAWRRVASVAACLVLMAGLTAAGIHHLQNTTTDPIPYTSADLTSPITTLYNETVEYDDELYRWTCTYRVPQLNFDTEAAKAINEEIAENFGADAEEQISAIEKEDGIRLTDIGFYEYYNERNIITLVCYKAYAKEYIDYTVYHYDADNCSRLSNTELLTELDIEPAEYKAALKQAAASRYLYNIMQWSDFSPGQCPSDDFRWEQYRKTVSDENLDVDTVPMYVSRNENGTVVTALPNIYALAGADYYAEMVTVMGGEPQWGKSSLKGKLEYRTTLDDAWGDGMDMTLYWTDPDDPEASGVYDTMTLPREWYYERFCVLLEGYTWTQYDGICPEPGNFWLNLSGGGINWTFWDDGEAGYLLIQTDTVPACWKADFIYDADREGRHSIADCLRQEYDGAAVDLRNMPLDTDAADSDALALAAAERWGQHLCGQAPGSVYGATDYRVVSTKVKTVADPPAGGTGHAILFDMTLAVKPELEGYASWLWAGNSYEGTGEWEGWMMFSREVILQQLDGVWYFHDYGTGGMMLPVEHGVPCECPAEDVESPAEDSVEEAEPEAELE